MLSLNTVHPSSSAFSYSAPRQLHQSRRQKNAGPVGFQFSSHRMSLLRKARRRSFPTTKTTRAGMGENALGIFLISLLDDIAFIGLTSAAASATTTTNFALLGDLSESNPGDVEAPTGAIFALAILIGGGFLVATTFGLKPGADAQDEMRKRDEAIFNKPIQKKEKKGKK